MMQPTRKHIEIGDRALTMNFNFGMMRLAERELGQPIYSAFAKESGEGEDTKYRVSFDALSVIWWASLHRKHKLTRDGADALVDEAGFEQVAQWIADGLTEYFGGAKAKAEGDETAPAEEADEGAEGKAPAKRRKS